MLHYSYVVLVDFCEFDSNLDILGKRAALTEKIAPSDYPVGKSVEHFIEQWLM